MSHIVAIVEHDIDRVLGFSHRVTVMNEREILMTGSPDEVRHAQSRSGADARRLRLRARPRRRDSPGVGAALAHRPRISQTDPVGVTSP
jgi:energy-coupling factor transporter ATP-binding protein EcfA2